MRSTKPHVKSWQWGGPKSKWVIDGLRDEQGKRIRKFFPSRESANEWLAGRRKELRSHGRAAMALTDAQRVDAVRAMAILAPFGSSLTEAAEAYAERQRLLERTVTFAELRAELIPAKTSDGASARYLNDLNLRLARAGEVFDDRPVATIEPRELDDWLRSLELAPVSRNNFRKVLRTAFSFAISRGYARENPVMQTAEAKQVPTAPGVLTSTEIAALLNAADVQVLPWLAIAAFAGLRDAEVGKLTWDRVDLAAGYIRIDAAIAKTTSRRLVPILPNLAEWLAPHAKKAGPVRPTPRVAYPLAREARAAAFQTLKKAEAPAPNLKKWPHNALRHSFASYRLADSGNAAQTAEECGHSVGILKKHYRELATKAVAEAWFAVRPPADGGVVPFAAEA